MKIISTGMHNNVCLPIIGRRKFLQGAAAMGLLQVGVSRTAAAEAKKGGRLRIGVTGGSTNDTLDPALILDVYMTQVSWQLRNCLTEIAADGSLVPELAESWEASPDAKTWAFKIREGIEFHNGKTLNAADVVASINHHRSADSKSTAKDIVKVITDIKGDGDYSVVMTLDAGNADFPYLLSTPHLGICPAKSDGKIDWESGTGTGGYVLELFEPGKQTLTKRNANYWKEGRAYFDEVQTVFISDVTARTNALLAGEIDVINKADIKTLEFLKSDPNIQVLLGSSNQHVALPMHAKLAPFDNNDIRLALKYAVNRQELLDKIFGGYGDIGNDHPIGGANRFRATVEEIPQRPYDPEKAKFHLKKAGVDKLDVKLSVAETAFAGATDAGLLYSEAAKSAGINIEVVREANDGYWDNIWLKAPWCASFWAGRPTEDWALTQVYSSGAAWNESHWENERFNELLIQARSELDDAKRREMYVEMQRILNEEGSSVIPVFTPYVQAASKKLALPEKMGNNFELDGNRCAERWSFA